MKVDFYNINDKNRKTVLFSIEESFFEDNYPLFKSKGIDVDIYGTTVLSIDKTKMLLELLNKNDYQNLFDFLSNVLSENVTLIIEGN